MEETPNQLTWVRPDADDDWYCLPHYVVGYWCWKSHPTQADVIAFCRWYFADGDIARNN